MLWRGQYVFIIQILAHSIVELIAVHAILSIRSDYLFAANLFSASTCMCTLPGSFQTVTGLCI